MNRMKNMSLSEANNRNELLSLNAKSTLSSCMMSYFSFIKGILKMLRIFKMWAPICVRNDSSFFLIFGVDVCVCVPLLAVLLLVKSVICVFINSLLFLGGNYMRFVYDIMARHVHVMKSSTRFFTWFQMLLSISVCEESLSNPFKLIVAHLTLSLSLVATESLTM